MSDINDTEALIRRYLLGQTSEDETEQVERLLLTNQVEFEHAVVLEDELADEYVGGQLSSSERSSFEHHYAVGSGRRQKILFAKTMREFVAKAPTVEGFDAVEQKSRPSRWAKVFSSFVSPVGLVYAAAVLLLIAVSLSLALQKAKLNTAVLEEQNRNRLIEEESAKVREKLFAQNAARDESQHRPLETALQADSSIGTSRVPASMELAPGLSRGVATLPDLTVPNSAELVELDLRLFDDIQGEMRAELFDGSGREVAMQALLHAVKRGARTIVPVSYPAQSLPTGDYKLQLNTVHQGGESTVIGNYYFRIDRHSK